MEDVGRDYDSYDHYVHRKLHAKDAPLAQLQQLLGKVVYDRATRDPQRKAGEHGS